MKKVLIEIPEEKYIRICDEPCTELALAVRNGTVLPDNLTNGDMIKALFPTADIATNDKLGEAGTVFVHHKDNITIFHLDWWNAPYREDDDK